jgi:flavorubredoxin
MRNVTLFENEHHRFVLLNESEPGEEHGVPSNQYLLVHEDAGVLFDPGGFGVMPQVLAELMHYLPPDRLKAIFLSHQDPDIVGSLASWLELTRARVYVASIWLRFLPHYGIRDMSHFVGVPDEGMNCTLAPGLDLCIVPAHFLHSPGHINAYDPVSKILFSGDIGAAVMAAGSPSAFVDELAPHLPSIEPFHRRYMACNRALRHWVKTVSALEISMIAPQHGPVYRGRAVAEFLDWAAGLACGADLLED